MRTKTRIIKANTNDVLLSQRRLLLLTIVLERERERDLCNSLFPKGNIFPNPESSLCLRTNRQKTFLSFVRTKTRIIKANNTNVVFFPISKRRVLFVRSFVLWARTRTAMWCWPFEQRPIIIIIIVRSFVGSVFESLL